IRDRAEMRPSTMLWIGIDGIERNDGDLRGNFGDRLRRSIAASIHESIGGHPIVGCFDDEAIVACLPGVQKEEAGTYAAELERDLAKRMGATVARSVTIVVTRCEANDSLERAMGRAKRMMLEIRRARPIAGFPTGV
ncbi:MAG TPA: hypothetical protein VFQ54_06520, partial [Thermomicrobiales bacterium]|nr:hypothetical protein [Thermomicrobiales bacterium]